MTAFALTLNGIDDNLKKWLAPTDTRLRPDQRDMEDGLYDRAADENIVLKLNKDKPEKEEKRPKRSMFLIGSLKRSIQLLEICFGNVMVPIGEEEKNTIWQTQEIFFKLMIRHTHGIKALSRVPYNLFLFLV